MTANPGVTSAALVPLDVARAPIASSAARRAAPPLPGGEVALEPPPAVPQPTGARWQQLLTVLPMLAGTLATAMMFGGRDGASPYTYVVGGIFGLSTLGMLAMNWGGAAGPRKAELMRARRDYLRYVRACSRACAPHRGPRDRALRHPSGTRGVQHRARIGRAQRRRLRAVRVGTGPHRGHPAVAPVIDPADDWSGERGGCAASSTPTRRPDLAVAVGAVVAHVLLPERTADASLARAVGLVARSTPGGSRFRRLRRTRGPARVGAQWLHTRCIVGRDRSTGRLVAASITDSRRCWPRCGQRGDGRRQAAR